MTIRIKSFIAVLIMSCSTTYAAASHSVTTAKSSERPPQVSAADAKLSFWDMPYLEHAFVDTTPQLRKDKIKVGELGIDGGNKQKILQLAQDIVDKKFGLVDSLLIAQNGKLLFESYYLRGRVDLPHMQASTTKAYVSLAIGRAIELGYLTMDDLDKPLVGFLKELAPEKFIDGAQKITLHQALTMRSGLRITREQAKAFKKQPEQLKGQGQIQTFLEHSTPVSNQSQYFHYQDADPTMVMQVLQAVVPGSARAFIEKELLDKMGIADYGWRDDVSGLPMAPYWSSMTSRDMFKWGTLVMNDGKYNGQQLISKAFIERVTKPVVQVNPDDTFFVAETVSNPGYGYFWWQADMSVGNKTYSTTSAQGGGGQYIILIKELDLIIVTTAHEREDKTMQMAAERILPAFVR